MLKKLHTYLYFTALLFFFGLIFPLLYYYTRNYQQNFKKIVGLRKWFSVTAAKVVGFKFQVEYESTIDWSKPYILCPNHTSLLDITAITYSCPQEFSFMGKKELLNNPVTRIFFKTIDIAVDRESKISAFKAFKAADQRIKEGKSVVIFPEGKIDDEYPPRLHEFKSGSFRLAIDNKIQILPIVITNAWEHLFDDGSKYGSTPGTIHIKFLNPIDTNQLSDQEFEELQDVVYKRMSAVWNEYNSHKIVK